MIYVVINSICVVLFFLTEYRNFRHSLPRATTFWAAYILIYSVGLVLLYYTSFRIVGSVNLIPFFASPLVILLVSNLMFRNKDKQSVLLLTFLTIFSFMMEAHLFLSLHES